MLRVQLGFASGKQHPTTKLSLQIPAFFPESDSLPGSQNFADIDIPHLIWPYELYCVF